MYDVVEVVEVTTTKVKEIGTLRSQMSADIISSKMMEKISVCFSGLTTDSIFVSFFSQRGLYVVFMNYHEDPD